MTQRKIMNVSGDDLVVPWLDHRVVLAGEIVLVAEDDLGAYLSQPGIWEPGDSEAADQYAAVVAEAEQVAQVAAEAHAEANPTPFDPGPPLLGVDSFVPLAEQPPVVVERFHHEEAPAAHEPVAPSPGDVGFTPEPEPATAERTAPAPTRTADPAPLTTRPDPTPVTPTAAPEPEPAAAPEVQARTAGDYAAPWLSRAEQALDRTNAPADDTVSGILQMPRQPRL